MVSISVSSVKLCLLMSRRYYSGIEFWRPGSGIIHQIVLENYAAPGMLMYASVTYAVTIHQFKRQVRHG